MNCHGPRNITQKKGQSSNVCIDEKALMFFVVVGGGGGGNNLAGKEHGSGKRCR